MRWYLLAFAAGCGRIAFDPLGESVTCVPEAEVCNGVDDDCNERVDEGCPCTPFVIMVPTNEELLQTAALAWTGTGYVLAIRRGGENRLLHIGADGTLGADYLRFTGSESFVWDGRLIAFSGAPSEVTASELALDGTVIAQRTLHAGAGIQDVWGTRSPGGFDVSWLETIGTQKVGRVLHTTTDFNPIGTPIGFGDNDLIRVSGHARGGNDVLVVVYRSINVIATIAGSATPITMFAGLDVAVSANADGFGIAACKPGSFVYAHADRSGVLDVAPTPFGTDTYSAVTTRSRGGSHVAIAFGNLGGVFAADRFELDAQGTLVSMTRMFAYTLAGGTVATPHNTHVDAERTAVVATFASSPGPTITMFAQTCP